MYAGVAMPGMACASLLQMVQRSSWRLHGASLCRLPKCNMVVIMTRYYYYVHAERLMGPPAFFAAEPVLLSDRSLARQPLTAALG